MQHEATFRMLDHVMEAHSDDRFGELTYVAGHLVVVEGFVEAALEHCKGHSSLKHQAWQLSCAALGHDLKEDHLDYWEAYEYRIRQQFGDLTINWIEECTENQDVKRAVRKERQIFRITVQNPQRYSTGGLLIKMGDWYGHLMPWGNKKMLPGAVAHAKNALKAIRLRLGDRPDLESPVQWASFALAHAVNAAEGMLNAEEK